MPQQPTADRRLLLLAAAIAEWSSVLDHLDAVEKMGHPPERGTRSRLRRELDHLIEQWPRVTSPVLSHDQVVTEAREYVTKHQHSLDELIGEQE